MKGFDKKNFLIGALVTLCILISTLFITYLLAENRAKKAEIERLQQSPRQISVGDIAEWIWEIVKSDRSRPERAR